MRVAVMRQVDRWIGIPTCAILTLVRRLGDLVGVGPPEAAPRSILFVKLAEQGSTVLAASAFREAIRRVGREQVYFLCFAENRFILDAMDLIPRENVVAIPTGGLPRTILGAVAALGRIRRIGIDTAIDLEFFARSTAALTWLTGASRRVGLHACGGEGPWRGDLMTHRLRYTPHLHASRLFRLQVEALDADPALLPTFDLVPPAADEPAPPLAVEPNEIERVRGILRDAAGTGEADPAPLVLLNANCSDLLPLRAWAADRYVALARRLLADDPALRIGFTGAPDEADAVARLVAEVADPRCFLLAGRTTLRELIVLYGLAEVLVTNDSGPAHFASLTAIDVVTLFGPEHPRLFAARGPRNHVIWAGLACSPCVSALNNRTTSCTDNRCMQGITVDEVLATTTEILAARRGDRPRRRVVELEILHHPAPADADGRAAERATR